MHTSVAESICNDRITLYLRRRLYNEYKSLIARAKAESYSLEQVVSETLDIRNNPTYRRNHESILPYAFEIPLKDLSKYADAVTRVTKNNLHFTGQVISTFATMTDKELLRVFSLTFLGNLAYLSRKSKEPIITTWALGMFRRAHEVMKSRPSAR